MVSEDQLLRVHAIDGEWLRFRVESESDPNSMYQVDLAAYRVGERCNGQCSCDQFNMRCLPRFREIKRPTPKTRCKHIQWAIAYFGEFQAARLADYFRNKSYAENTLPKDPF